MLTKTYGGKIPCGQGKAPYTKIVARIFSLTVGDPGAEVAQPVRFSHTKKPQRHLLLWRCRTRLVPGACVITYAERNEYEP